MATKTKTDKSLHYGHNAYKWGNLTYISFVPSTYFQVQLQLKLWYHFEYNDSFSPQAPASPQTFLGSKGGCSATYRYNQEACKSGYSHGPPELVGGRISESMPQHPHEPKGFWETPADDSTHFSICLLLSFSHPCLISSTPSLGLSRINSQINCLQSSPRFRNCFGKNKNYDKGHFLS